MKPRLILIATLTFAALLCGCVSTYETESDELRRSYLAGDMSAMEYLDAREEVDKREKLDMYERQSINRQKHESITLFGYTLFKGKQASEYDKPWNHDNTNFDKP